MPDGDRRDDVFERATAGLLTALETCPRGQEFKTVKRFTSDLPPSVQALVVAGYNAGLRARPATAPAATERSWVGRLFWWGLDVLKKLIVPS